jgi:predicted Rossmann fold flavoprotein
VIVAVGGRSYPGSGTSGDGYIIAQHFGHTLVAPRPALVPIRVDAPWVPTLRGLTVPDVSATVRTIEPPRTLAQRREALLFAHFGLTGPAILDVSSAVARHEDPAQVLELAIDWIPAVSRQAVDEELQKSARSGGRRPVASLMPPSLPHRLCEALVRAAGIPENRKGPDLSRIERNRLVDVLKSLRLRPLGTLGFEKAEVTSGGLALDEVSPQTLESRRQPGLIFCGEVLDLDGPIGGYNFQAAWSTGWLAGQAAASAHQSL